MNKKSILFTILLTTLLFTGCSSPNTSEGKDTSMLSEKDAQKIVLEKIPGATEDDIAEFRKAPDHSGAEYEGEIHYNGMEYEFEMNAYNGTILEWSEEPIKEMAR